MWCEAHLTNWLHTRKNTTVRYTITKGVLNENVDLAWHVWKSYIQWNEKNLNRHNKLNKNGLNHKIRLSLFHKLCQLLTTIRVHIYLFCYSQRKGLVLLVVRSNSASWSLPDFKPWRTRYVSVNYGISSYWST